MTSPTTMDVEQQPTAPPPVQLSGDWSPEELVEQVMAGMRTTRPGGPSLPSDVPERPLPEYSEAARQASARDDHDPGFENTTC